MKDRQDEFRRTGAFLFARALRGRLRELETAVEDLPKGRAGLRLSGGEALRSCLSIKGDVGAIASQLMAEEPRPVRAILFDKSTDTNWTLGWHQDRTICVAEKVETSGFGPWTVKQGLHHVAPPFELLERMVTLRVHLDDVPEFNAPLKVAIGSHRLGRIPEDEVNAVVQRCDTLTCLAAAGDVWAYATPVLHASDAAQLPTRRRVLQVDYSTDKLPNGLEWLGV